MSPFQIIPRFLVVTALLLPGGCQWSRATKPLTPSQLLSSERSQVGMAALEREDFEEAEKRLSEAVRLNKKDIAHRRNYAEALWKREKYKEALQQLDEAVKRGGAEDASLHVSLAEKNQFLNQSATAFHHADQAVELDPNNHKSWALRGTVGWRLALERRETLTERQYYAAMENAKNDFYRALSLAPDNREILPELAAVQMYCGQPEHALATWQKLQGYHQPGAEPVDLLRGKAEALIALHCFDEAMDCLNVARQREPGREEIGQRIVEVADMMRNRVF